MSWRCLFWQVPPKRRYSRKLFSGTFSAFFNVINQFYFQYFKNCFQVTAFNCHKACILYWRRKRQNCIESLCNVLTVLVLMLMCGQLTGKYEWVNHPLSAVHDVAATIKHGRYSDCATGWPIPAGAGDVQFPKRPDRFLGSLSLFNGIFLGNKAAGAWCWLPISI